MESPSSSPSPLRRCESYPGLSMAQPLSPKQPSPKQPSPKQPSPKPPSPKPPSPKQPSPGKRRWSISPTPSDIEPIEPVAFTTPDAVKPAPEVTPVAPAAPSRKRKYSLDEERYQAKTTAIQELSDTQYAKDMRLFTTFDAVRARIAARIEDYIKHHNTLFNKGETTTVDDVAATIDAMARALNPLGNMDKVNFDADEPLPLFHTFLRNAKNMANGFHNVIYDLFKKSVCGGNYMLIPDDPKEITNTVIDKFLADNPDAKEDTEEYFASIASSKDE